MILLTLASSRKMTILPESISKPRYVILVVGASVSPGFMLTRSPMPTQVSRKRAKEYQVACHVVYVVLSVLHTGDLAPVREGQGWAARGVAAGARRPRQGCGGTRHRPGCTEYRVSLRVAIGPSVVR